MVVITGGKYQGKKEFAVNNLNISEELIVPDFCETVREIVKSGNDPAEYVRNLEDKSPDVVILADEIGCGIIPADDFERSFRETYGRLIQDLCRRAKNVYRVTAGLGIKLK